LDGSSVTKILAVDDRPANLLALQAILEPLQLEVVEAHSGKEALSCLLRDDFALILMDVHMPELDGFETTAIIKGRERCRATPVIFISAVNTDPVHAARGYSLGAVDYLTKPVDPDALRAKIAVLVELYRKEAELKRREAALAAELERAQDAAARLLDEWLGVISHELRAPLHAIAGWTELLRSGKLEAQQARAALDTIARTAHKHRGTIDDLTDAAKILAGDFRLQPSAVSLAELVGRAVADVEAEALGKGLQLAAQLDEAGRVNGDGERLHKAVRHLLSNAIKFTPPGGRIGVRLERKASELVLTVEDDGEGIAPELLPHVFQRFRQGDGSIRRASGGLGLGLTLVERIVALHSWTLKVESPGRGLGTRVTLRARPAPIAGEAGAAGKGTADSGASLTGLRVLVVDDEPEARELLELVLVNAGAEVIGAGSVRDAMVKIACVRPALVLTDLGMPGVDGYALV
jgi:signal transduction histidine kinase